MSLRKAMAGFDGGHLVVHVCEMPIKCPVAPLEFAFLADHYFKERGIRDQVKITFATPLSGAFTKPVASQVLGDMFAKRDIQVETDFYVESIGPETMTSYDERTIDFDLLVTTPVNMGAKFVRESGLGDELDHVKVDHGTFLAVGYDNIFAIGDAAALPTSKAQKAREGRQPLTKNSAKYLWNQRSGRIYIKRTDRMGSKRNCNWR